MRKLTLICAVVGLVFPLSTTQADVITTPAELQAINDDLTGDYVLGNDIDLTGFDWARVGPFEGTFDGNFHTISGLTMDADRANLFSTVAEGGEIANVGLTNVNITAGWYAGALVGNLYGTVSKCWASDGTVTAGTSGAPSDYGNVGTLVGLIRGTGSVLNSYSTLDLILQGGGSPQYCGGLTGGVAGLATNSYFAGEITDPDAGADGFAGYINEDSATSCYYDMTVAGFDDLTGLGRTTTQMMQQANFVGWDFVNTWTMVEGQTYPTLIIPEPSTLTLLGLAGLALLCFRKKLRK